MIIACGIRSGNPPLHEDNSRKAEAAKNYWGPVVAPVPLALLLVPIGSAASVARGSQRRLGGVIFKVIRCFFKAVCVRCAMLKVLLRVSAFEIIRTISSVLADMRHFMRKDNRSSEMIGQLNKPSLRQITPASAATPKVGGSKNTNVFGCHRTRFERTILF